MEGSGINVKKKQELNMMENNVSSRNQNAKATLKRNLSTKTKARAGAEIKIDSRP